MNDTEIRDALTLVQRASTARRVARREALLKLATGGAVIAAGMALPALALPRRAQAQAVTDTDILNFALNLEFLEAEYYTLGTTGRTLESFGIRTSGASGAAGGLNVKSNPQVPFATPATRAFFEEVAADERAHIQFLQQVLGGSAIARPAIDYTGGFNTAAQLAGIGSSFDPFADEVSFTLGAYTFSDVSVTALKGASPLISSPDILDSAAGLLGTEGYHVGGIRLKVYQAGPTAQANSQKISALRDTGDNPRGKDIGVGVSGLNLINADSNAIVFSRNTSEVIHIAYLNPAPGVTGGGFFPNGLNGTIRVASV